MDYGPPPFIKIKALKDLNGTKTNIQFCELDYSSDANFAKFVFKLELITRKSKL